jgi:hypothetical protein
MIETEVRCVADLRFDELVRGLTNDLHCFVCDSISGSIFVRVPRWWEPRPGVIRVGLISSAMRSLSRDIIRD